MTRIRVMAAVVRRDGKLLLCQRPSHKRHGGLWEFPGGKILDGETDFEATKRELLEELGVTVVGVDDILMSVHDEGSVFRIDFIPTQIEGDPQSIEHDHVDWVSPDQLLAFDLAPSDRVFSEWLIAQED